MERSSASNPVQKVFWFSWEMLIWVASETVPSSPFRFALVAVAPWVPLWLPLFAPPSVMEALPEPLRADAAALLRTLQTLAHRPTWLAVQAERAVSRGLGGSCSMPLAAHAVWDGQRLRVDAALGDAADLTRPLLRCSSSAHVAGDAEAVALGERCVAQLHALGAEGYLAAAHGG